MEEKNLQLERMVFFCDAVVAIAITLLVFNIKIERKSDEHLQFADILKEWKLFLAFFLSFINIASFWKTHHMFFAHIKKIDEKLLWCNICWLFFIVLLPFSTSLVSAHFFDTAAIFIYSLNTLLIAVFQNAIWDYTSMKPSFLKHETIDKNVIWQMRLFVNLDMINAVIAVGLSFFTPVFAFISLLTKLPMILIVRLIYQLTPDGKSKMRMSEIIKRPKKTIR